MTNRDDDLLLRLLTGDLEMDDEETREAFEKDPKLIERYEEARAAADLLDAAGEFHQELAREVDAADRGPEEEEVERFVRARTARRGPGALRWVAAAAAVIALVLVGVRFLSETPPAPPDGRMLGGTLGGLSPAGEVERYEAFTWEDAAGLAPGGWYEVRVTGVDGSEVARSGKLEDTRWEPAGAAASAWPDALLWEVRTFDGTGALTASAESAASRRTP